MTTVSDSLKCSKKVFISSLFDSSPDVFKSLLKKISYTDDNFYLEEKIGFGSFDLLVGNHILSYEDLNHEMLHLIINDIYEIHPIKDVEIIDELIQGFTYFHKDFVYAEDNSIFYDYGTLSFYHNGVFYEYAVEGDFYSSEVSLNKIISKVNFCLKNPIK